MTGEELLGRLEIATNCVVAVAAQAFSSAASDPSITAKSAVVALSDTATRTVASLGSSVKLTRRSACQGALASWTVPVATAMQGRSAGKNPMRARIPAAINGTTETRTLRRS